MTPGDWNAVDRESERLSPRIRQHRRERAKFLRLESHRRTARTLADIGLIVLLALVIGAVYLGCIWLACIHR